MLFDIFNYSIPLALVSYAFFFGLFIFLFRRLITNYADPLVFHILWLSSQAAFFVIYAEKYSISLFYLIFIFSLVVYVASLLLFLPIYAEKKKLIIRVQAELGLQVPQISLMKWRLIVSILFFLFLYSNKSFFQYAITCNSPAELFLYRFVALQGRDAIERILGSANFFLLLYLFYGFHKKISINLSFCLILFVLLFGILSGGRSALIGLIASVGTYVFYFSHEMKRDSINKLNRIALVFICIAMALAVFVSSFYEKNSSLETSLLVIFNRIFAAPDGIEYYLKYFGENNIEMGVIPYFLSIFGIYVKNIIHIDVKNIGWQLTELVVGSVDFAQGSNYTVLLQSVVFNYYLAPIYAVFIAWIVSRLRYIYVLKWPSMVIYFVISNLSFTVATDIEYFIFLILSVFMVYFVIIYPVMKVKL